MDGETSVVKFGHHSRAYLEGLTKFWGFWGSSAPAYSPFCTLKTHTFDPKPLANPSDKHDRALEIQIDAVNYVVHMDLVCLGDDS